MRKLELKDFLNYKYLSKLAYSTDGKHAAFVVSNPDWDTNGYKSDIYVLNTASEKISRLTSQGDAKTFRWLSEREILFPAVRAQKDKERRKAGEKFTVFYKISIDGGEAEESFRVPYEATDIKKISDGLFALLCKWHPADPDFSSMNECEKSTALKELADEKDYEVLDEIPFWSNGEGFTNKKRSRLFVFDAAKNCAIPITDELSNVVDFKADSTRIAFCAKRYDAKMDLAEGTGVFVYHLKPKRIETLLPQGELQVDFIDFWDGDYIIKGSDMKTYGMGEFGHFYTIRSGKLEMLAEMDEGAGTFTNSDCRYGAGTVLKVHNQSVYYTAADHVQNALRKIDSKGKVTTLCKMYETIDGFDIFGDEIIYFGLGPVSLHELFKLEGQRCLSSFNAEALRGISLQTPERCDAKGERESIEGFVLKPADFDPNKKYPAVLHIHGGPRTAFGNSYFHEMHMWSSMGYFVLFSNPWGSDGRGNKFADLRGQYGTVDYDDLMAFTDNCLKTYPQIDERKVAVTGGSYGGFMTNWIIGHTDRFICAASQRSIANWISKFGTTDIGYYFNADQQGSTPWDKHDKMWWHSPMKYADKVKTPTLFIHSEEDYRCWLAEGLQMFTSLKYHGAEARLCMFRGENHELSRSGKPKHRVRRMTEIINWFEKYVRA